MAKETPSHDCLAETFTCIAAAATRSEAVRQLQDKAYAVLVGQNGLPQGLVKAEVLQGELDKTGDRGDKLTLAEARQRLPRPWVVTKAALAEAARQMASIQAKWQRCGVESKFLVEAARQMGTIQDGTPGMVVMEGNQVVGVLPREKIAEYLAKPYQPPDRTERPVWSGIELPGTVVTPPGFVHCEQSKCGADNEIEFLDPGHLPPCRNKQEPEPGLHLLKLSWL